MSQCIPDYNSSDFHPDDFFSVIDNNPEYSRYLFETLPVYYKENDTYKDANGQGLLERFLMTIGYEIDYEIIPAIECYLQIIDATLCEEKFLIHLSDVLGNPPDIFGSTPLYRKLLRFIVAVYKIKGTKRGYELFFSLLGYNIDLVEIEPDSLENQYDTGEEYDTDNFYDQGECTPCSFYDITFYPKDPNQSNIAEDLIIRLMEAINFNEPINARLRTLTFAIRFEDSMDINLVDETTITPLQLPLYDEPGDEYDGSLDYETPA